jgi:hypothetical protein
MFFIIPLVIATILTIIFAITFLIWFIDNELPGFIPLVCFIIAFPLWIWIIAGSMEPWKVQKELNPKVILDESTGAQIINYQTPSGEYKVINLNVLFARMIPPGTSVKIVQYSPGPYIGLYYPPKVQYLLVSDKNEVIAAEKEGAKPQEDKP